MSESAGKGVRDFEEAGVRGAGNIFLRKNGGRTFFFPGIKFHIFFSDPRVSSAIQNA